jgi:hypothetical protein
MTRIRRRRTRQTRVEAELWHLTYGKHAPWEPACTYTEPELALLWNQHRDLIWDEFTTTNVGRDEEYAPWGALMFDGAAGDPRPLSYPYHHLRGPQPE